MRKRKGCQPMEDSLKKQLSITAARIRQYVIEGTCCAKSGHPGGSLSVADLMAYLYFVELHVDPQNPRWPDRDRLVLSKGHTAPALYGALVLKGFFSDEEIKTLRHTGAMLQGHPDMKHIWGGYVHRFFGAGDFRRRGNGAGRQAGRRLLADVRCHG